MTAGGAVLVALLLQGAIGAAGTGPEAAPTRARLELRGAGDCISRGDLTARVAARSLRIQFVEDAAIYAQVVLTSARPGNVIAELVLATPGAEQPARRFVARTCAEAADAIALIIAVTLDPTGADVSGKGAVPTDARSDGASPAPPAAAPPAPPTPAPPAAVQTVAAPVGNAADRPTTRRHFGAYVAGQTIFGPAPAVMPGVAVYGMAALDGDGVWAPALFVGATHAWRNQLFEPGGTASFALDAGSVDACPLRLTWSRFAARPCASVLAGGITASGADTGQPATVTRPFAAAGVALAMTARLGTVVELSTRLGAGVTLRRDSYHFGDATFHRADAITTTASLGIGLRWP